MEYLVLYDTDCYTIIDAVSVKDCIIQMADFFGDNSELFGKALNGCTETEDMVKLLNHFSTYTINAIYELQKQLY
ncbi:MAG: hypothetical protein J6J71_04470 [Prevotella sp.]|nr:hypothetical protein [Prevotella sp.]